MLCLALCLGFRLETHWALTSINTVHRLGNAGSEELDLGLRSQGLASILPPEDNEHGNPKRIEQDDSTIMGY